jgi:hypothetical protein
LLSLIFYWLTIPLVVAYQKARDAKSKERNERRHKLRETLAAAAAKLTHRGETAHGSARGTGDDDPPGPT